MWSKWRILSFFLVSMGLIPIILLMGFFIPGVQKYLIEEPLQPFLAELGVSEISAETLYISPFSIEIKQLHVQYEGIEISINQLDSEFSPFSLLSNRIKINQLIADQIIINDQSLAMPADDSKSLPFYGLFPYFDSGFVYEIKRLDIQAQYTSKVTGFVQLSLIALDVDENTQNPIVLKIDAQQLTAIPNIKGLSLNASIALRQQTDAPVNAQQSFIDLVLTQTDNSKQFISTQLSMSQLAKPDKWQSFPFTNKRNNYLKERLHPEAIELQITHSDEQNKQLALVKYKGRYDGNEGIISGDLKLQIAKDFTQQLKPLSLPDIDGFMEAKFAYNIRSNEGNIKLINEFNVSHYANKKDSSLPEKIEIFSHLSAQLDDSHLQVKRLFLDLISNNKKYINIFTHKALSIQLDNLSAFIAQENSELFQFNINQLPLKWLNDFIPEQIIQEGSLDTEINLAIEDKALKLITKRPINIHNLSIIEKNSPDAEEHHQQHLQQTALLFKQNISSDLAIHLDENNFNATIKKLSFFHHDKVQNNNPIQQLSSSIKLNIKSPMTLIHATNPPIDYTLETDGDINLLAISKLPLFAQKEKELSQEISLTELSSTLPKAIALKYAFSAQGNAATINLSHAEVSLNAGNSPKQSKTIISLIAAPNINIQLNATKNEQFKLLTSGKLLTAKVQNFKFNWLSPFIKQVTAPYTFSGQLAHLDMTLSAQNKLDEPSYSVDISTLKFSDLKAFEDKQGLFEDINIHSKIQAHYANNQLSIHYPSLKIFKNKTQLLNNSGKISINNLNAKDKSKQHISISGKLDSHLEQLMRLKLVNYYTKKKAGLTQPSILNARYQLKLQHNNLTINQSKLTISHPESQGKLVLTTHKAITLSLKDKQHNFSQDGHLSFELINFDLKPYETIFPQTQVSFQYANGLFDLIQTKKHQRIVLQKPFKIHNIRIAHKNKTIFNPFDLNLDFSAQQHKNIAQGEIKKLSIQFIDNKDKKEALSLQAKFQLDMDKEIILQKLDGSLDLLITQLLKQPGVMPHNTLAQGLMQTQFSLTNNQLKHHWSIKNLVDNKGEQLVEAITIEGTGQIKNKHNFSLNLPIVMQSISGTSQLDFKTQTSIHNKNTQVDMSINGHDVFLNDLLKLLAAIDPHTDNEDEDHIKEDKKKSPAQQAPTLAKGLDKTPAKKPFWRSGVDISAQLKIDQLYYSDYMSYQDIRGELIIDDNTFHAKDLRIKFHNSPMKLDTRLEFTDKQARPYDIQFKTSLAQFKIGDFLKELNPKHVPRADGVFDVNFEIFGDVSNLGQWRNELLFNLLIEGRDGVYHLIPANDIMMRSSGTAMVIVGEVVSVLPTSGFGLGIVNRVIHFAKDIDYDFIRMHLVRNKDLNTTIKEFNIVSPELHLIATGGISFKEDTRLFDQPMKMTAQLNLAGEGAAIFYGLGLLKKQQDKFGFWLGPTINFSGTMNNQTDNFNEIINEAKEGTLVGGFTNPFSGLVGNFRYRWFDDEPHYESLYSEVHTESPIEKQPLKTEKKVLSIKSKTPSFFDETF